MKHTLTSLAALLVLTITAAAGDGRWATPVDINAAAKRERGDVCYRGVTQWNIAPAHRAAAATRHSGGFVATPPPRHSGAGTYVVPAGTIPGAGGAGSLGVQTGGHGVAPSPN